jgi:hypothetical protein
MERAAAARRAASQPVMSPVNPITRKARSAAKTTSAGTLPIRLSRARAPGALRNWARVGRRS